MNVSIIPAAETLIQQFNELGHDSTEIIIEEAFQYFYSRQLIDTSLGFPELVKLS